MVIVTAPKGGAKYLGCLKYRRYGTAAGCRMRGALPLGRLDAALKTALAEYFSDTRLAEQRMERFLEETNKETQRQRAAGKIHEKARDEAQAQIERIKAVVLSGGAGPTTAGMLKHAEANLAAAETRIAETAALATCKPALMPPQEVIAALHRKAF